MYTYQKLLVSIVTILLLSIMSASAWSKASLTDIRIGQSDGNTRVVFDIKNNHRFEIAKWHNPPRIVIDFYKSKNNINYKEKKFLDKRLKTIRLKNQGYRTRIVLYLRKNFDYNYFVLGKNKKGAERVVVDLNPKLEVIKIAKVKKIAKKAPKVGIKTKELVKLTPLINLKETKELIVAIDAGHGGKDPGAIGPNNLKEKVVALKIAKKLKKYIDAQPGMRAVLTRSTDIFIPLQKRVRIAKQKEADIFVSIHADAWYDKNVKGGSVYVLSTKGASSVMARMLAKSQNASIKGINLKDHDSDVAFILSDLTRSANIRASKKLGKAVLGEMGLDVRLHKSSVQHANFAVLKSIDMPSILIETAFLSNPEEARKLKTTYFQEKMAKSIVRGLSKFAKRNAKQPRWGESLYVKYKVQRGDTLSQIANNYGIAIKELRKINHIKKANHLFVGKRLKIPVSKQVIASL